MTENRHYSKGVAYFDNAYIPVREAKLPILDWGFTRSDVTYDVVHVWQRKFFRLDDHLERFRRSCEKLKLDPRLTKQQIQEILVQCVLKSRLDNAYVEVVCTRGEPAAESRDPRTCHNRFFAFAIPYVWVLSPEVQERGARLFISDIPRISPQSVDPTVKNFHWADLTRGLFQSFERGDDTVVLVDHQGNISEGPGFNVFCVKRGAIISPRGTVLEGVTRSSVEELCDQLGIPISLGKLTPAALREADEIFLSSTAGGIMPVKFIDGIEIGSLRENSVSTRLRDLYWLKHSQGWHATPIDPV